MWQVRLADGSQCEGAGPNKKTAKQQAARLMLDILDGRAKVRPNKNTELGTPQHCCDNVTMFSGQKLLFL